MAPTDPSGFRLNEYYVYISIDYGACALDHEQRLEQSEKCTRKGVLARSAGALHHRIDENDYREARP